MSNIGGVLGEALGQKLDPIQAKRREPDTALLAQQMGLYRPSKGAVVTKQPFDYYGTKVSTQLVPRIGISGSKKAANVPAAYAPKNTNLEAGKVPVASDLGLNTASRRYGIINPGFLPDGEVIENTFGDSEIVSTLYGGAKIAEVGGYSAYRNIRSAGEDAYKYGRSFMSRPFATLPPAKRRAMINKRAQMKRWEGYETSY
jgi:hypothetical protein